MIIILLGIFSYNFENPKDAHETEILESGLISTIKDPEDSKEYNQARKNRSTNENRQDDLIPGDNQILKNLLEINISDNETKVFILIKGTKNNYQASFLGLLSVKPRLLLSLYSGITFFSGFDGLSYFPTLYLKLNN